MKKVSYLLAAAVLIIAWLLSYSVSASAKDLRFSDEYKTSPYYEKLMQALHDTKNSTIMERTLAVAQSQEGYFNFATEGYDLEKAREEGKLWTGAELRMNINKTGNTEYTRWAQRYVMESHESEQYADYDWCAIFVSWCLYQAGYYTESELKRYFYSNSVDTRVFWSADEWIGTFSLDQRMVYYAPVARKKLSYMPWNTYYNVDISPYDMPYKPGGLVFFGWSGTGDYFSHVGIVVNYDPDTHVLTYINGNYGGMVITWDIDLDVKETFRGLPYTKNAKRIMAYADYDEYVAPAQKEIHTDSTDITWDVGTDPSLKIMTDSESILASVYLDGEYFGSIIESNMVFHEGLLTIGRSELEDISVGSHVMKLVFDDGELELTLNITDKTHETVILGDADCSGDVNILDATAIQRRLASLSVQFFNETTADADGDSEISILDANAIQRWLANLSCPDGIGKPVT